MAGETVLDIGSGSGIDPFEAARQVGPFTPHFAVINRAGEPVAREAVACGLGRSCC